MSKTYSEQITKTQSLLTGLKKNIEIVRSKGLNEEFINKLESDNNLVATFDKENEQIKADLKNKIVKANSKLDEIKKQVKEAKRIIKSDFDQSKWISFGITDKK
jgi:hypothetical protein